LTRVTNSEDWMVAVAIFFNKITAILQGLRKDIKI
jgi:hypothetical protein